MKKVIKEGLREIARFAEAGEEEKPKGTSGQYERVRTLLANNIFNHAGIIERLWGKKDATNRSLFKKKLDRAKNDAGGTYSFSEEEISRIIAVMMDTSRQISSSLGREKKSKE